MGEQVERVVNVSPGLEIWIKTTVLSRKSSLKGVIVFLVWGGRRRQSLKGERH